MIDTVAALKRALPVGTKLHVTNHYIPGDSRDVEVVDVRTTQVALSHHRAADGKSWLDWPKRAELVPNEDGTVTILGPGSSPPPQGEPFLTLRWLA